MQTINLDFSMNSVIALLRAKQGDVGRKFKAILTDGGAAYPVPAGAAVSVWYSGTSGEGNYTDIGADSAVSVSGNEITVELITQMLANYGEGKLCLAINTADGDQIGTWNIPYMVEPLPGMGSAAAQAYFTAFSQAVQNLPYPDPTLSVPGRAADAGAVGTALAGKAPAGFGLGSVSSQLIGNRDCNTLVENGWYMWNSATVQNVPFESGKMLVIARDDGLHCTQIAFNIGTTNEIKIRSNDGSGAWSEWVNWSPSAFAPAGYGFGESYNPYFITEGGANDITVNGLYQTNINTPDSHYWLIAHQVHTTKYMFQFAKRASNTTMAVRTMHESVWWDWEYINPPMEVGVEYRTTERWNGKPVWTAYLNLGLFAAGMSEEADTSITATQVIRYSGTSANFALPELYASSTMDTTYGNAIQLFISYGTIRFRVCRGTSYTVASPFYAQAWYTKD